MKNVFKMMCIALAACTMIVSCTEKTQTYTIKVSVNDEAMGTVTGGGDYDSGAVATLTATPNNGYVFVSWSDGNTENPRQIVVSEDLTLVATFAAARGANVRFGAQSWNANDAGSSYGYLAMYDVIGLGLSSSSDGETYPLTDVYFYNQGVGEFSDSYDNAAEEYTNNIIAYVEYYENNYLTISGYRYGDWWAKTAVFNVSAFDATSLNLSMVCNATMFDAEAVAGGTNYDAAATENMVVSTNLTLTSSKSATLKRK